MKSLGIDIVEHSRFHSKLEGKLINKILSPKEIEIFESFSNTNRKVEYIASRFASKEAIFKAFEVGPGNFLYSEISILNKPSGAPYIECERLKDYEFLISISHSENFSIAQVIIK